MLLLLLFNACSPISFLPFNFLYSPQELNIQEEKKKAPKILPFQEKSVGNKNQIKNKTLYKNLQCHHWPEMRKISDWAFTQHSVVCTKLQFLHSGNQFRSFQDNPVFNIKAQSECKPRVTLEFKSGIGKPNLQCLICYWCVVNKLFNYHWFSPPIFPCFSAEFPPGTSLSSPPMLQHRFFLIISFIIPFIASTPVSHQEHSPQQLGISGFCPSFPPHSPGSDSHTGEGEKPEFPSWQPHLATG